MKKKKKNKLKFKQKNCYCHRCNPKKCNCQHRNDLCVIDMGGEEDDIHIRMEKLKVRGEPYWWLYMVKCKVCNDYWLIAQEERHNDIYCLYRLNLLQVYEIKEKDIWPEIFDKFENLLKIGYENNKRCSFLDPENDSPIAYTIEDLAKERPFIKISELSKLLNIDIETTLKISEKVIKNNQLLKITLDT